MTNKIESFVTDLSPNPLTGGIFAGGEEGRTYPSMVKEQGRVARATPPKVQVLVCPPDVAERLGVSTDAQVISRSQKRYIDETLWSLQTSYYPLKFITEGATRLLMAEDIQEGTVIYLANSLGLKQAAYEDWITARPSDEHEQKAFGLPHDGAMFVIYRTAYTEDRTATRVTVTVCPADRNQFRHHYGEALDPEPKQASQ